VFTGTNALFHYNAQQSRRQGPPGGQRNDAAKLDRESLPQVRMPDRDGFIADAVFKVDDERQAPRRRRTAP
jgi:hypothetical protein